MSDHTNQLDLRSPQARALLAHFLSSYFAAGRYQFTMDELRQMLDQFVFHLLQGQPVEVGPSAPPDRQQRHHGTRSDVPLGREPTTVNLTFIRD